MADIVGDAGDVGKEVRNFLARLAVFLKVDEGTAGLQRHVLQLGQLLAFGERLGKGLPSSRLSSGLRSKLSR